MKHLKPYQEYKSTFTHLDKEYDLHKMFKLTKDRKSVEVDIKDLKWILKYSQLKSNRIRKVDKNIPILIGKMGKKWVVYDGVHRLSKAINSKDETIKAIKVPNYILKQCLIDDK